MEKPISMVRTEFRNKLIDLVNESGLPAWVMVDSIRPVLDQLETIEKEQAEKDVSDYWDALKMERAEEEGEDGGIVHEG